MFPEVQRQAVGRNPLNNSFQILNRKMLDKFNSMNNLRLFHQGPRAIPVRPVPNWRSRRRNPFVGESMAVVEECYGSGAVSVFLLVVAGYPIDRPRPKGRQARQSHSALCGETQSAIPPMDQKQTEF